MSVQRASDADSRVHEVEMTEQHSPTPSGAAGTISANNNDITNIDNNIASNSGSNANNSSGGDGGVGLQGLQGARVLLSLLVLVTLGQVYMLWPSLETLEAPLAEEMASNGPLVWSSSSASPPPPLAECEDSDRLASPRDREAAVARAVHRVFERGQLEVPPEGCRTTEPIEVNFRALNRRIKTEKSSRLGCIVYLAQKRHSSYDRNSLGMLRRSLDLLYENYNQEFRRDVLVFHTGDFDEHDEVDLRKNGTRNEIYLVEIPKGSRYWELPGFLDRKDADRWSDNAFSEGYRHMCRWYAGRLFEFVENLGYEFVMRMDEDSFLLSKIRYDLFEFMRKRRLQYAYRLDAFEPCCDDDFRQRYIKSFLDHESKQWQNKGFLYECCWDKQDGYSSYGYYNNFFITEVSFWRQEHVRRLFSFVDWTGGFFLFRENDLVLQSLSVQLFMPKERVHKFTDWSYEHISGVACEWGGVVRGTDDEETNPVDAAVAAYAKRNSKALTVPRAQFNSPANYSWNAVYCAPDNYRADVEVNFHKRDPARVPSHRAKAPFCFDLLQYDHKEDGPNRGKRFRIQIPRRGDLSPGAVLDDRPAHLAAAQASRRFQLAFDRLRTCDVATPTSRVAMHVEPPECGAGCSLNYLVSPLLHAISTDQAFLTPASMWASRSECGGSNSLSCFLQAFAKRDDSLAQCAKSSGPRYEKEYQRWRRIGQDDYGQWSGPEKLARSASGFEDFGIMWNVGQVLKNLLQFSPHVERELARRVRLSGLDQVENQPVLGLHVRLGDACSDPKLFEKGRRCDPLSYYMPALKLLRARYGFKSVYLATDSAEVIRNATTQYRDFKWLYNDAIDRSRYGVFDRASQEDEVTIEGVLFGDKRLHDAGFSKTQEMVDFLVDTYILGVHTSGFVGKFTSNMDRIVTALGAATGNEAGTCLKPTISLDSDWCYDFMVQSGLGLNGKLFFC